MKISKMFRTAFSLLLVLSMMMSMLGSGITAFAADIIEANLEGGEIPDEGFGDDLPDLGLIEVNTADELQLAIDDGYSEICIAEDFVLDRTFYITRDIKIYSDDAHTLTRAANFAGDIFVVGEAEDGANCGDIAFLTLGNSYSSEADLLIFDGNKDGMNASVVGTVVYITNGAMAEIHENVTFKNNKKVGNERSYTETDSNLPTDVVGGAAIDLMSGTLDIYGGKFLNNEANTDDNVSVYGGAIFAFGTLNIYGATFDGNIAKRAGAIYNYRIAHIYKADFINNTASTAGGAIYIPASTLSGMYLGGEDSGDVVLFENNTAAGAGGALYVASFINAQNVTFRNNESTGNNGGAISAPDKVTSKDTLTIKSSVFEGNCAYYNAGAVYMSKSTGYFEDVEFKENHSYATANSSGTQYGSGAVYLTESTAEFKDTTFSDNSSDYNAGAIATYSGSSVKGTNVTFSGNTASQNGGVIYSSKSNHEWYESTFEGNSAKNAGAIYLNTNSTMVIDGADFTENTATTTGGAIYLKDSSSAVLNDVTATANTANTSGFLYNTGATLDIYNSTLSENESTANGGAIAFDGAAVTNAYNTVFEKNVSGKNGGALYAYSAATENIFHSCSFDRNTAAGFGGAVYTSNTCISKFYNTTAQNNSAGTGGFMYETTSKTEVTLNGLKVSGNTATVGGPIIWGNTTNATLYINKSNYTDNDASGTLDDAYWAGAIANKLTVYNVNATIPSYKDFGEEENPDDGGDEDEPVDQPIMSVSSAKELETALKLGFSAICVTGNFELDRTFYITKNTKIYSEAAYTLTRAANFAGDIFVVGVASDGTACEDEVTLTLGEPTSDAADLLTFDGNKNNINATVVGTVVYITNGAKADIYANVTFKNNKKVGNERSYTETDSNLPTDVVGGAAIDLMSGTLNIYGTKFLNNEVIIGKDGDASAYGGAIFAFGKLNIYGATFENNAATRAGAIYNYRIAHIYKAEFKNNSASTMGGAIYIPASSQSGLYLGGENVSDKVVFDGNTSVGAGGAINVASFVNSVNAEFKNNKSTGGNGGAIAAPNKMTANDTLTLKNTVFDGNSAYYNGGAVHQSSVSTTYFENVTFKNNHAYATANADGKRYGGGALYITGSYADLDGVTFTDNSSGDGGGAVYIISSGSAIMNNITASGNSATNGGFLYNYGSTLNIYNSTLTKNSAVNEGGGGAIFMYSSSTTNAYNTTFKENSAAKNGGALYAYAKATDNIFHSCTFDSNTAGNYGGAVYTSNTCISKLYNTTAKKNSAKQGGFLYETTTGTAVTLVGLTLLANTATSGGPIIWGNSTGAKLYIDKSKYVDSDKTGELDSTYWSSAIANKLTVEEITDDVPRYNDYKNETYDEYTDVVDVASSAELEKAINDGAANIRITKDFTVDRTFFITKDTVIFTTAQKTLKRAPDFDGDIFVVGEDANGNSSIENGKTAELTLGNKYSDLSDLLIIDGNKDNMTVNVTGTALFLGESAVLNLYKNVTIANHKKVGNVRTLEDKYKFSSPNRVGGAAIIVSSGIVNIHGSTIKNNICNNENTAEGADESERDSSLGGAVYSRGTINIHDGIFKGNEAARGGFIYNMSAFKIYAGEFIENHSFVYGGAIYLASSQFSQMYAGNVNSTSSSEAILFKDNYSDSNAGALYCASMAIAVIYGDTTFDGNKTLTGNGAAIGNYGMIKGNNIAFKNNYSYGMGGAVYVANSTDDRTTREVTLNNCSFENNIGRNGGALAVYASSAELSEGGIVDVIGCNFIGNKAINTKETEVTSNVFGGAVYITRKSTLTITDSNFEGNEALFEGGAIYAAGESTTAISNTTFNKNKTTSETDAKGGAVSVHSAALSFDNADFTENTTLKNGGALYVSYTSASAVNSAIDIANSSFSKNTSGNGGGAIYATKHAVETEEEEILNIKNTSFSENTATNGGALYLTSRSETYMKDVTFTQNSVTGDKAYGGAIYITGNSLAEIDGAEFTKNTSTYSAGAVAVNANCRAILNKVTATENSVPVSAGFLYSNSGRVDMYENTITGNTAGANGGGFAIYNAAVTNVNNTVFDGNKADGYGGAVYDSSSETEAIFNTCTFKNGNAKYGGAIYVNNKAILNLYRTIAELNSAKRGGFMYETAGDTTVTINTITVNGNSASEFGPIIYGDNDNAILNIHKLNFTDSANANTADDAYWDYAIVNKLTVNDISGDGEEIPECDVYESRLEDEEEETEKPVVPVTDVLNLGLKSSNGVINPTYGALPRLDNSSNFMSRSTTVYENINGEDVTVDTFVSHANEAANNGSVGVGLLIYQAILYKEAHPEEDVEISFSSFRFSSLAAVNINRNSRYFGYMRNLPGQNYDSYGFVRISYLLITAAKMGIKVTAVGQLDGYPHPVTEPTFDEYMESFMDYPCDPAYVENGKVSDFLNFELCQWTSYDDKAATDMMHNKMCAVSHYLDMNGVAHKNAVWSSSSNLDGIAVTAYNGNNKMQTSTIVSDHEGIYLAARNYTDIVTQYCGQEDVYIFRTVVGEMSKNQIDLIEAGKDSEISPDERIVYLGSESDDVFEFYFAPFGGDVLSWTESYNPYCKYARKFSNSDDYVTLIWNSANYDVSTPIVLQIENMLKDAFVKNKDPRNAIYINLEEFDYSTFDDMVVGEDIGYMSFNEMKLGALHNKDLQLSYSENGKRQYVSILSSINMHGGAMSYQSNFVLVIKEDNCNEDSVYFNLADQTSVDMVEHTYGEVQNYLPDDASVDGYTYKACQFCDKQIKLDVIHRPSEWLVAKESSAESNGIYYQKCLGCSKFLMTKEVVGKDTEIMQSEAKHFTADILNPIKVTSVPHTFEAVINVPETVTDRAGVIIGNFKEKTDNIVSFEIYSMGRPRFYYQTNGVVTSCIFSYDIRSNKQEHVAISVDDNVAILYVNGKKIEEKPLTVALPESVENLVLGGDNRAKNTQYFKGSIYSAALFANTKSDAEIKADSILVSNKDENLLYLFDYKAAPESETTTTSVSVKLGGETFSASKFHALDPLSATPHTIEATVHVPTNYQGRAGVIFGNYVGGTVDQLVVEIYDGGKPRMVFRNNAQSVDCIFNADIRSDDFRHIAITVEGNVAKLYVDGELADTQRLAQPLPVSLTDYKIGGDNRYQNTQYFKGEIKSVVLFDDARTATEIKADSILVSPDTTGLIYSGYFNANTGKFVSLNGRTFSETEVQGVSNVNKTPYTIQALINVPADFEGRGGVIAGNYEPNSRDLVNFEVHDNGKLRLYWRNGIEIYSHIFENIDVRTGSPEYVALTINGTKATLYLNGEEVDSATLPATLPAISKNYRIGGDNRPGNTQYFKGTIYGVAMYNSPLAADEIANSFGTINNALMYNDHFTTTSKVVSGGAVVGNTFYPIENSQIPLDVEALPLTFEASINLPREIEDRGGVIVGNYDPAQKSAISFEVFTEGRVRLYHKYGVDKIESCMFDTDIRSDKMVHVAITVDGYEATLYIDGEYAETKTMTFLMPNTFNALKLGGDNRKGNTQYFKGTIGSVALFSDVRTAEEIKADAKSVDSADENLLCNMDLTKGICPASKVGGGHIVSDWIVVREPSDNAYGLKHKECTLCGTVIVANEYTSEASEDRYIDYSKSDAGLKVSSLNDAHKVDGELRSAPKTFEANFLLKKSQSERAGVLMGNYDNSNNEQINVEIYTNGKPRLYYKTNGRAYTYLFNTDVRSDSGTHLAITIDGLTATLYLNGVAKETVALDVAFANATANYVIGADNREFNPQYFKGIIYSVAMFDDVRNAEEIAVDMIMISSDADGLLFAKHFMD